MAVRRWLAAQHGNNLVMLGPLPAASPGPMRKWTFSHFASLANAGNGGDLADPDGDGLPNLIEFATGPLPGTANRSPWNPGPIPSGVGFMDFEYTRSKSAKSSVKRTVEWSDSLGIGTWNTTGITETFLGETGDLEQVRAAVPVGSSGKRFGFTWGRRHGSQSNSAFDTTHGIPKRE